MDCHNLGHPSIHTIANKVIQKLKSSKKAYTTTTKRKITQKVKILKKLRWTTTKKKKRRTVISVLRSSSRSNATHSIGELKNLETSRIFHQTLWVIFPRVCKY